MNKVIFNCCSVIHTIIKYLQFLMDCGQVMEEVQHLLSNEHRPDLCVFGDYSCWQQTLIWSVFFFSSQFLFKLILLLLFFVLTDQSCGKNVWLILHSYAPNHHSCNHFIRAGIDLCVEGIWATNTNCEAHLHCLIVGQAKK